MNADPNSRCTSQQLMQQITERIEELAQATDVARMSEEMLRYLDTFSRFHHYSLFNTWLILMACPQATAVAGFHAWHKLNRFVRKGEHGIAILAPMLMIGREEEGNEKKVLCGFKVVYVFDVSQTDGEPLPEPPDWKSPERNALLTERLMAFAREYGITITEKVLDGETQGVSMGGVIAVSPTAGTSTIVHELAHELLHKGPNAPVERQVRELEAEAVAFCVSRHFGLDSGGAPNYVALHGATSEQIRQHLETVRATAAQIIETIEASVDDVFHPDARPLTELLCYNTPIASR